MRRRSIAQTAIRGMPRMGALIATLTGALGFVPLPAIADEGPFAMGPLQSLSALPDSELDSMRGKYIPPQREPSSLPYTITAAQPDAPARNLAEGAPQTRNGSTSSGPSIMAPLGGQVVYFGVEMVSQWQVGSGQSQSQLAAGAALGVNLRDPQHPQVSSAQWNSAQGQMPPASVANGDVVGGAPLTNMGGGVGQSIQIAGNGNSATNQAQIDVGSSSPPAWLPVPTVGVGACGAACQTTIGGGMGVSITLPGGVILQQIGSNGVLQSAQLASDMNQIINTLTMHVQVAPVSGFNVGQLTTILQSMTGLR